MDSKTEAIVAAVFGLAIVVLVFGRKLRAVTVNLFRGEIKAEAHRRTGATVKGAIARSGSVRAFDETGQGATVEDADAANDVTAHSTEGSRGPK